MTAKFFQVLTALILMAPLALKAQDTAAAPAAWKGNMSMKTPEQRATALTDTLTSVLKLTSDQYQKAYASNLKFLNAKTSIKTSKTDPQTMKSQILAANKTRKMEIGGTLTPEQKA